jgi:hypothetical protein
MLFEWSRDLGRSAMVVAALLLAAGGCGQSTSGNQDDSSSGNTASGGAVDVAGTLSSIAGPDTTVVVGSDVSTVVGAAHGSAPTYGPADAQALVAAAARLAVPVCSVEPNSLGDAMPGATYGTVPGAAAVDFCRQDRQANSDIFATLEALKTPSTVVVVAANTAITVHSTNNGINFFYDRDVFRLLRAARVLYVPVCLVIPQEISLPTYPSGNTPGLSVDDALASCAR